MAPAQLLDLLVNNVADAKANELIEKFCQLGMREIPFQAVAPDSNLPPFDEGHHLRFSIAGGNGLFELLEKDGAVAQAGFQMTFPRSFLFPKAKKHHRQLRETLEVRYGIGQPMDLGSTQIINFANERTVAYISLSQVSGVNVDAITVRVGNRRFWG